MPKTHFELGKRFAGFFEPEQISLVPSRSFPRTVEHATREGDLSIKTHAVLTGRHFNLGEHLASLFVRVASLPKEKNRLKQFEQLVHEIHGGGITVTTFENQIMSTGLPAHIEINGKGEAFKHFVLGIQTAFLSKQTPKD